MKSKMFLATASSLLLAVSALAADISGNWTAEVPGGATFRSDGQPRPTAFVFKVEGEKLTGKVSVLAISEGTVKGNDLAFTVLANFNGAEVKHLYKGKIAGEAIKMTRTREGSKDPAQEFTATRAK